MEGLSEIGVKKSSFDTTTDSRRQSLSRPKFTSQMLTFPSFTASLIHRRRIHFPKCNHIKHTPTHPHTDTNTHNRKEPSQTNCQQTSRRLVSHFNWTRQRGKIIINHQHHFNQPFWSSRIKIGHWYIFLFYILNQNELLIKTKGPIKREKKIK